MPRLTALLIGTAAGGGYPQWNCRCPTCQLAWAGDPRVRRRTQTSVAVSADGASWTLLNAAPELLSQIERSPALQPQRAASQRELRGSPISAVVLSGAEVDQTAGLFNLREGSPFDLIATDETHRLLDANPMFDVFNPANVRRREAAIGRPFPLPGRLEAELFAVAGKVPLYAEAGRSDLTAPAGGTVGIEVRGGDARLAFVPGAAALTPDVIDRLARADAVLFDGTLFTDDEMIRLGASEKTGLRMGHMPVSGPHGSLQALNGLSNRRIYLHINNTNPMLVDGSPERLIVEDAGWTVAHDGLEIAL